MIDLHIFYVVDFRLHPLMIFLNKKSKMEIVGVFFLVCSFVEVLRLASSQYMRMEHFHCGILGPAAGLSTNITELCVLYIVNRAPCSAVQCRTVQCSAVQCSAVLQLIPFIYLSSGSIHVRRCLQEN